MHKKSTGGRGTQINISNKFSQYSFEKMDSDNPEPQEYVRTRIYFESPKKIISKNNSPDIPFQYSVNPYQGCEHGCVYCYARNSHHYWGFGSGIDFESRIIAKPDAPVLLEKELLSRSWKPDTIMLSGNTDCYQPVERKLKITRGILKILAKYRNPAGIVTKNSLILRDLDILQSLAEDRLIRVVISITSMDEKLRRLLEPRSTTVTKKLNTIRVLSDAGIQVGALIGPVIPGLNNQELPAIIEAVSKAGAKFVSYSMIRLNGDLGLVFKEWLRINFPDRANKVWNQICALHGGTVNDSIFGKRMSGSGVIADSVKQLFHVSKKRYFLDEKLPDLNTDSFRRSGNYSLFN